MKKRSSKIKISLDIGENDKDPAEFRDAVVLADKIGFQSIWLGDHFMPWVHSGNRSSYIWSLLGPCLEASRKIKVGPYVTTPLGMRYHPAIVAQASATLDNMYPGRFLLSVGTGEAMNEVPFLGRWPDWNERIERLIEGIQVIRKMWESKSYFDFDGKYFKLNQVYLYTKPRTKMKIYFSGIGPKAARAAGQYGDALITLSTHNSLDRLRDVIFPRFEEGARAAGKDPAKMEKIVSVTVFVGSEKEFLKWAASSAGVIAKNSQNESDPRKIEEMGKAVPSDVLLKSGSVCSSWSEAIEVVSKFQEIGTTEAVIASGPDPKMIRQVGAKLLKHFNSK